jgi:hypothetical protein
MKHKLISTLAVTFTIVLSANAFGAKKCTDEPESKWMTQEAFKAQVEAEGYKIRKFKQPGSCYEIYGTDKEGKKVEIYFNPVDGSIVKFKGKK